MQAAEEEQRGHEDHGQVVQVPGDFGDGVQDRGMAQGRVDEEEADESCYFGDVAADRAVSAALAGDVELESRDWHAEHRDEGVGGDGQVGSGLVVSDGVGELRDQQERQEEQAEACQGQSQSCVDMCGSSCHQVPGGSGATVGASGVCCWVARSWVACGWR